MMLWKKVLNFILKFATACLLLFVFTSQAEEAVTGEKTVSISCGDSLVSIVCGKVVDPDYLDDPRACNSNKLIFKRSSGETFSPKPTKGFDESKTPVALSCRRATSDQKEYLIVELSNGHPDCLPCMTYHLFDHAGNRLSGDKTSAMSQYAKATKQLGISSSGTFIRIEGGK